MIQRQRAPEWGPDCVRCGHPKLVHRGPAHDGNCAAVQCAKRDDPDGWNFTSKCESYVAPAKVETTNDSDQPFARVREDEVVPF